MSNDIKMLLVAGIGVAFLAWGVVYSSQVGALVNTTATGYGTVIKALEPPSLQTAGGTVPNA